MFASTVMKNLTRKLFTRSTRPAPVRRARLGLDVFEDRVVPSFAGAIYDTEITGTEVNQNIYTSKDDVYLNGGPQNRNAAGLEDGTYYFQVTDPSGATLLSEDLAVFRQVKVVNGRLAGTDTAAITADLLAAIGSPEGPTKTLTAEFGGLQIEDGNSNGFADEVADLVAQFAHPNGTPNPANGSIGVQLMPFADTTNPGGEYKVTLITKAGATILAGGKALDFSNSNSKNDNFKVLDDDTETVTIQGMKFYDQNGDGVRDLATDLPIGDWEIELYTESNGVPGLQKDGDTPDTWLGTQSTGSSTGTYSFSFEVESGDTSTYYVAEVMTSLPGTWYQTTFFGVDLQDDYKTLGRTGGTADFGNVQLGAGGGLTLGFWSNKNGQKLVDGADLAALSAMNLVNADGSNFDPSTAAQLRTWLLNGTATNMSYMLSVQLAAMKLNVLNGFVSETSMVYAPGVNGANAGGFISIGSLIAKANDALFAAPVTTASGSARSYNEVLKNALDGANNNQNFILLASAVDTNGDGVINELDW
jgi:hypothetical protein